MSENSLGDIADLTDRIYEAVYDDSQWVGIMGEVKAHLRGSHGAFGFVDEKAGTQHMLQAECTPEYAAGVFAPELANPLLPRLFSAPAGDIFTDQSVMPKYELEKTIFFNEWFRPQGEHSSMNVIVLRQGEVSAHLTMMRGGRQPPFEAEDLAFVRQLLPTLMRVAYLRMRVGALRLAERADAYEALQIGLMVVDRKGRLLLSNAAAERFLAGPPHGLDVQRGQVSARSLPERDRLRRAIANACSDVDGIHGPGGDMLITNPSTGLPLASLSVAPMYDAGMFGLPVMRAAAIFIQTLGSRPPPDFELRLRAMFGLTGKEAKLAVALASGQTLTEAAEERHISLPTVRTQLAEIFRKTNTSRQSQLVSLLLRTLPVPR